MIDKTLLFPEIIVDTLAHLLPPQKQQKFIKYVRIPN